MNVSVGMIMLLYARVHIRVYARVDARVHWWILHGNLARGSLHGSNDSHILYTWVGLVMVYMVLLVVLRVL